MYFFFQLNWLPPYSLRSQGIISHWADLVETGLGVSISLWKRVFPPAFGRYPPPKACWNIFFCHLKKSLKNYIFSYSLQLIVNQTLVGSRGDTPILSFLVDFIFWQIFSCVFWKKSLKNNLNHWKKLKTAKRVFQSAFGCVLYFSIWID